MTNEAWSQLTYRPFPAFTDWAPRGFDHVLQQTRELQRPTGTGVLRLRVRAVFPKNRV